MSDMQANDDLDDEFDEIDTSIQHPSPDELGLLCFDDPNLLDELDRRLTDDAPTIPWSVLRDESM